MATVAGLAGRPHWIRELSQPFGPAKVRCFNHGETIHALVKRSRQPGWRRHVSRDARRWGKGDLLPVPADETPVDSRQGLLCTISITGKQRRCSVWKRASTGIWAIAAKHLLAPDHVLVDVAGGPGPRIYALVGERKGKLLSISLRQIYAD